jgi:CheY-like chemotaxis protein
MSVLIVARPGRRRDNLRALLRAVPQLHSINQADDGSMALHLVNGQRPTLILLDSNLPEIETRLVLEQVKTKPASIHCLVLADTLEQRRLAEAAHADAVLTADFSITNFLTAAEKLLN